MKTNHFFSKCRFRYLNYIYVLFSVLFLPTVSVAQGFSQTKTLNEVFQYIEDQSEYSVFYQNSQVDTGTEVVFNSSQKNVDQILVLALKDMNLNYTYVDDHIVIIPQAEEEFVVQETTISGQVTDENGETLIGVTISLKGTSTGTISDLDGNYSITVPDMNHVLVFSYVGYKRVEVTLSNLTEINVTLTMSAVAMDEVVVV